MISQVDKGMGPLRVPERLSEDLTFMFKIWAIPGRENSTSKDFRIRKKNIQHILELKGGQHG